MDGLTVGLNTTLNLRWLFRFLGWLCIWMWCPFVPAKVAGLSESFAALRALVGLLAAVDSLVRAKAAGLSKRLAAMHTLIRLLAGVGTPMQTKTAGMSERLAAPPTLVGF